MNTSFVLPRQFDHKIAKKFKCCPYAHTPPICPNIVTCIRNEIGATRERIKESGCLIQFYRPYGERGVGGGGRGDKEEGIGVLNS